MADYRWQPAALSEVFVLPAGVVDEQLNKASHAQLQVLLWLSRHHQQWDAAACGAALGLPAEDCAVHLQFWVEHGLLAPAGSVSAAGTAAAPLARPAAVKPRVQEVLAYQRQHPDFAAFLEEASARLGKAISHSDTATLLYLLDTVGLPRDVILTEIGYAVSIGKANMHYVEKLALDWTDKDITTLAAVDKHIRDLERCQEAATWIEQLLQLSRPLNATQRELAVKWQDWGFSEDMLRLADRITRENTGKFSPTYFDGILKRWRAEGIDTVEKAQGVTYKKKGPAATNPEESSLDTDEFDQALLRYRPQRHKTE